MALPVLDVFSFTEEDISIPPVCESEHCEEVLGKSAHEAHFIGIFACCGWDYLLCKERVALFATQNLIICNCKRAIPANKITIIDLPK